VIHGVHDEDGEIVEVEGSFLIVSQLDVEIPRVVVELIERATSSELVDELSDVIEHEIEGGLVGVVLDVLSVFLDLLDLGFDSGLESLAGEDRSLLELLHPLEEDANEVLEFGGSRSSVEKSSESFVDLSSAGFVPFLGLSSDRCLRFFLDGQSFVLGSYDVSIVVLDIVFEGVSESVELVGTVIEDVLDEVDGFQKEGLEFSRLEDVHGEVLSVVETVLGISGHTDFLSGDQERRERSGGSDGSHACSFLLDFVRCLLRV